MKTYTVKQVADVLDKNPETVRRWIRDNKLHSTKSSNKEGNAISEEMLVDFAKKYPKYAKKLTLLSAAVAAAPLTMTAGMLSAIPAVLAPATLTALPLLLAKKKRRKGANDNLDIDEIKSIIAQSITAQREKIKQTEAMIQQLQAELAAENEAIRSLQETLSELNTEQTEANVDSEEQTEGESQKEGK